MPSAGTRFYPIVEVKPRQRIWWKGNSGSYLEDGVQISKVMWDWTVLYF